MKNLLFQITCAIFLLAPSALSAGYVGYLCPAGAEAGTVCEVIMGGRGIGAIRGVIIDGDPANKDVVVESVDPVPGGLYHIQKPAQKKYVDQCIRAVFQKKSLLEMPKLPEDTTGWNETNRYLNGVEKLTVMQREMLVRGFYTRPDPLQSSPSIASKAIVTLKIMPDAKPGLHHLRFTGNGVIFNPVPFFIGDKHEFSEPLSLPPPGKMPVPIVTLPAVLNGHIMPGETDSFNFEAKKGQTFTFRLYGRALLPFIGDGVPGHFQPVLQITDKQGKELAFQDDTYFDPDPVLTFTVPEDGEYTLAVRDAICRGRDDFVYRIDVAEGVHPYTLLPFPDWGLPLKTASERAEPVPFPCAVDGVIMPGKTQKVCFELKKGADAVLEVYARRALSPLDSSLTVFGPDGKQVAFNDDYARPKVGPVLHHADSYLRFTAPQDGLYTAEIADTAGAGGKDYRYRLRISEPRPDFRVWSVPSGLELTLKGGSTPVGFVVERIDGHVGDIVIQVEGTKNVLMTGNHTLPYGGKRGNSFESVCGLQAPFPDCAKEFLTLAPSGKNPKTRTEQLHLTARCGSIAHSVIPADESMQAFAYNHLTVADDCFAVITRSRGGKFAWPKDAGFTRTISPGQELELQIDVSEKIIADSCSAELFAPPAGFTLVSCKQLPDAVAVTGEKGGTMRFFHVILRVKADRSMKPIRFNQIVQINFKREYMDKKTKTMKTGKDSVFLSALLFEVKQQ